MTLVSSLPTARPKTAGTSSAPGRTSCAPCFPTARWKRAPAPVGRTSPVPILGLIPPTKKANGELSVVAGEGHEFVEDTGLLLATGPEVPGLRALHKLPHTHAGYLFLPLALVTRILGNLDDLFGKNFTEAIRRLDNTFRNS